jgi:DNA polymerase-3 subunit gamma/tau
VPPIGVTARHIGEEQPPRTGKTPKTTLRLTDLLKVGPKQEDSGHETAVAVDETESFSAEQFQTAWMTFAEQRKKLHAEYQLLTQPYNLDGGKVTIQLLNAVQESLLNNLKSELITYLRETMRNHTILVGGHLLETEDKKMMYTARDKFEVLLEKNPALREMKDRLGLDADF